MNIKCWWNGHDLVNNYEYNEKGNRSVDNYCCRRCKKEHLDYYKDDKSFLQKHENFEMILIAILIFIGMIILAVLILCLLYLLATPVIYLSCRNSGIALEIPWKYDFWAGCFYKVNNIWVPSSTLDYIKLLGEMK